MRSTSSFARLMLILGAFALLLAMPTSAPAQADEEHYRQNSDLNKMFEKLGRGASNVLLGWLELPKNIAREWRRTEPFTGTIVGAVKGTGWAVVRTLAGAYEVVTFPFPVPRNYEPIMYPEFVLPTIWGDRLPLFRDEFLQGNTAYGAPMSNYTMTPTGGDSFQTYPAHNMRSY
jgi:putative exosortase-associated protein (TIGR04073 family)